MIEKPRRFIVGASLVSPSVHTLFTSTQQALSQPAGSRLSCNGQNPLLTRFRIQGDLQIRSIHISLAFYLTEIAAKHAFSILGALKSTANDDTSSLLDVKRRRRRVTGKWFKGLFALLVTAVALMPSVVLAQDDQSVATQVSELAKHLDWIWTCIAALFVFFMQAGKEGRQVQSSLTIRM